MGNQPENVHVARYIPQTELLPLCAAVISHGGSGTFLGALAHGLPQVWVPQGADQFANAEAGERYGAGLTLHTEDVTTALVSDAVEKLLCDESSRLAAQELSREISEMPEPAAVARIIAGRFM